MPKYRVTYADTYRASFIIEAESSIKALNIGDELLSTDFAENINESMLVAIAERPVEARAINSCRVDDGYAADLTAEEINELIGD